MNKYFSYGKYLITRSYYRVTNYAKRWNY